MKPTFVSHALYIALDMKSESQQGAVMNTSAQDSIIEIA